MTSIVIADDHRVVLQGLQLLLEAHPGYQVVGTTTHAEEVETLLVRLRPDVLLLDLEMPGIGGLEAARRAVAVAPSTRIVVLSMHGTEGWVVEALRCGACAYVLKGSSVRELTRAIEAVLQGEQYLSPPLSEAGIEAYLEKARGPDSHKSLTPREREVVRLTVQGLDRTAVAERLAISPRTVEVHRHHAMRKLGVRSRADLVRYALGHGIATLDSPGDPVRPPPAPLLTPR
jgi:DNA-binding NarL/FixJ family response regulator